jgi:ribosomal protein S18 acetylase RimI-like enzyme
MIAIRRADSEDFENIWQIFHEVVKRGDTYAFLPQTGPDEARRIWLEAPRATYVATLDTALVGTYFIKANQPGLGSHICNAGFMVRPDHQGKGVGRAMALHALEEAKKLGFSAMQFNLVVRTNTAAVGLWHKLDFRTIGTIPRAFRHRALGYVDAYIMYRPL